MGWALMLIGFLILIVGAALGAMYVLSMVAVGLTILIGSALYCIYDSWQHNRQINMLNDDAEVQEIVEQKIIAEKIEQMQQEKEHILRLNNQRNEVALVGLKKIKDLQFRYPRADKELFHEYLGKFGNTAQVNLDRLEDKIRQQHEKRCEVVELPSFMKTEDLASAELIHQEKHANIFVEMYDCGRGLFAVRVLSVEQPYFDSVFPEPSLMYAERVFLAVTDEVKYALGNSPQRIFLSENNILSLVTAKENTIRREEHNLRMGW